VVIATVAAASLLALWPASAAPAVPHAGVTYPVVLRSGPAPASGSRALGEQACEREIEGASRTGVPRVAIVGASFTAGVGSGPGRSWAVLLARHLRWDAVVDGIPGAGYVRAGADRPGSRGPVAAEIARAGLRALRPSLVIVQAGHDDIGVPPALERHRVEQAVGLIHAEAPRAQIVLLTVFPGRSHRAAASRTDLAIVAAARAADPDVIIIDPLAAGWKYAHVRDGLHPTAAGSAWIAGRVAAVLREYGVRPAPVSARRGAIICDPATARLRRRPGQGRVRVPGCPGLQSRQAETQQRPAAGRLLGPDRPAVTRGHLPDDGQPEA
jgi:acyl-CoA thioesterase-1